MTSEPITKQEIRLNIGCGKEKMEGFLGVDLFEGPTVDVVASADRLPYPPNSVAEIIAEHLVEHLTYFQFNKAIKEWYRVLKPEGTLTVECPDLLGLCKQFANGNHYSQYWTTGDYWPTIFQIYGHQRGNNPNEQLAQVHKSGYTEEHLRFVLNGAGFYQIMRVPHIRGPETAAILRLTCYKK